MQFSSLTVIVLGGMYCVRYQFRHMMLCELLFSKFGLCILSSIFSFMYHIGVTMVTPFHAYFAVPVL